MHWTLTVQIALCGLCASFNGALWLHSRSFYSTGLLVCSAWAAQQGYWWGTGENSLVLFAACDAAIIGRLLWLRFAKQRAFSAGERLIAATIPLTTALGAFEALNGGHTWESWWANWYLVAGQMLIGLPPMEWLLHRVAVFNRTFDPWRYFDLRKRHAQ